MKEAKSDSLSLALSKLERLIIFAGVLLTVGLMTLFLIGFCVTRF